MKRLRPIIVAVLLFAVSSIPTSSFALSYDLELNVTYFENGQQVGVAIYNSCFGHMDYSWGQQSGNVKRERYVDCDDGSTRCYWYSWNGSAWVLFASQCSPDGEIPDRDRPLR